MSPFTSPSIPGQEVLLHIAILKIEDILLTSFILQTVEMPTTQEDIELQFEASNNSCPKVSLVPCLTSLRLLCFHPIPPEKFFLHIAKLQYEDMLLIGSIFQAFKNLQNPTAQHLVRYQLICTGYPSTLAQV
jgi:hypothetical protein